MPSTDAALVRKRGRPRKNTAKSPTPAVKRPPKKRELEQAFSDLDAVLRAARRPKHADKRKPEKRSKVSSRPSNVLPLFAEERSPPLEHKATVAESPSSDSCHTVSETVVLDRCPRMVRAWHVLVYAPQDSCCECATPGRHMVASYTLDNGAWGTLFMEDNTCLQLLPISQKPCIPAKTTPTEQHDDRAEDGRENAQEASPRAASMVNTLALLLYVNPAGHSFILPSQPCGDDQPHVLAPSFPQLPACLRGKLGCVLKTRASLPVVESQGEVRGQLTRLVPCGSGVSLGIPTPLVVEECLHPTRWLSTDACAVSDEDALGTSSVVRCTGAGDAQGSRWCVPFPVHSEIMTARVASDGSTLPNSPHDVCRVTLANVMTPYPANAFYSHVDEVY